MILPDELSNPTMTGYSYLRTHKKFISYLGYCEKKGFIYSEKLHDNHYRILAAYDGIVRVLIHYTGLPIPTEEECNLEEERSFSLSN